MFARCSSAATGTRMHLLFSIRGSSHTDQQSSPQAGLHTRLTAGCRRCCCHLWMLCYPSAPHTAPHTRTQLPQRLVSALQQRAWQQRQDSDAHLPQPTVLGEGDSTGELETAPPSPAVCRCLPSRALTAASCEGRLRDPGAPTHATLSENSRHHAYTAATHKTAATPTYLPHNTTPQQASCSLRPSLSSMPRRTGTASIICPAAARWQHSSQPVCSTASRNKMWPRLHMKKATRSPTNHTQAGEKLEYKTASGTLTC